MALTPAEKMRRYREKIKNDPEKYNEMKKKDLQRIKANRKKVSELDPQKKEKIRIQWREQKKRQRINKNKSNTKTNHDTQQDEQDKDRPSTSDNDNEKLKSKTKYLKKKSTILTKKLKAAQERIMKLEMIQAALKKRIYRNNVQSKKNIERLEKTVNKMKAREEVLESAMKKTYQNSVKITEKRIFKKITDNSRNKKYVSKLFGLTGKVRSAKKTAIKKDNNVEIEKFFLRDDVSRCTAGKKECRTKDKKKCQIRYLLDTLQNLFQKYKAEEGKFKFTTFKKYKPFYILAPHLGSRNTCMCVKHDNIQLQLKELKKHGIIECANIKEVLEKQSCDLKSHICMHGKCTNCKNALCHFSDNNENLNKDVTWIQWERKPHEYTKKEGTTTKKITTIKTVKEKKSGTLKELMQKFEADTRMFKKHYFNVGHQLQKYQTGVAELKGNEALIICDFSQNYESKMNEEIQSMHFGASKCQISLHTGMVYLEDRSISFCTVSPSTIHQPQAIWAHLSPVLKHVKDQFPQIAVVHFYSDGPTSQYRQKNNFYLLSVFTRKLEFNYCTWSFFESGHGKGVADGIGATVKRLLDRNVCFGKDISDASDAFNILEECMHTVKVWYISEKDIDEIADILPKSLPTLVGTMQVHQVITKEVGIVTHRELGCFCGPERGLCSCFEPKTHSFDTTLPKNKNNSKRQAVIPVANLRDAGLLPNNDLSFEIPSLDLLGEIPDYNPDIFELPIAFSDDPDNSQDADLPTSVNSVVENLVADNLDHTVFKNETEVLKRSERDFLAGPISATVVLTDLTDVKEVTLETQKQRKSEVSTNKEDIPFRKHQMPLSKKKVSDSTIDSGLKEPVPKTAKPLTQNRQILTEIPAKVPLVDLTKMKQEITETRKRKLPKSLTVVVKRSFKCHLCKGILSNNKARCMCCSNYFCSECCQSQFIRDYICDSCLTKELD